MAATVIVLETSPEQIATTVDAAVNQMPLWDSEYKSRCLALQTALIYLSEQLKLFRVPDVQGDATTGIRLLVKARILASITYRIAFKLAHDPPEVPQCCCPRPRKDPWLPVLDARMNETLTLTGLLASYLQDNTAEAPGWDPSSAALGDPVLRSGVSTLTVTTPLDVDRRIVRGDTLRLPVMDANQKVIYTAKAWINNPAALFRTGRRMSARLEIEQDNEFGRKEWDIVLPERMGDNTWERKAFISCLGSHQAVVKSVLKEGGNPWGRPSSLLKRDHTIRRQKRRTVYKSQSYLVDVQLIHTAFEMGLESGAVRTLRVAGRKMEFKVFYLCFVQETEEVLGMYMHLRREQRGVFQFIGIGNYPVVRDIIVGTFLTMGLHSEL